MGENKLDGESNHKPWKKRIDLILEKNKVFDLDKGKVKKPANESSEAKEKFRETEILAMTLMVDGTKDNLIPYISNIDSAQAMDQ